MYACMDGRMDGWVDVCVCVYVYAYVYSDMCVHAMSCTCVGIYEYVRVRVYACV